MKKILFSIAILGGLAVSTPVIAQRAQPAPSTEYRYDRPGPGHSADRGRGHHKDRHHAKGHHRGHRDRDHFREGRGGRHHDKGRRGGPGSCRSGGGRHGGGRG